MQKEKSLKILNVIPTLGLGGAERWLVTLGTMLKKRGHEVHVAALWSPYTLSKELEQVGIKVLKLNIQHRRLFPVALYKICSLLLSNRYDIVHGHLLFGSIYSRVSAAILRQKAPVVSTLYNLGYDSYPADNMIRIFGKWLDKWSAQKIEKATICVSSPVASHFQQHLKLRKVSIIPLGVPCEMIKNNDKQDNKRLRQIFGATSPYLITIAARFVPEKGHKYFIQAINILKQKHGFSPKVILAGDGPCREEIQGMIKKYEMNDIVILTGELDHLYLMNIIRASNLIVLPSTHDGCPTIIIEAMSLGTPVIATAVGGLLDLVKNNETGILVPPSNPKALAEAIWTAVKNPALMGKYKQKAKECVQKKFTVEIIAGKYEEIYLKAITENQ